MAKIYRLPVVRFDPPVAFLFAIMESLEDKVTVIMWRDLLNFPLLPGLLHLTGSFLPQGEPAFP